MAQAEFQNSSGIIHPDLRNMKSEDTAGPWEAVVAVSSELT